MSKTITIACLFCLLAACSTESRFAGFRISNTGYHYKFHTLGEGDSPNDLDYVTISYKLREYKLGEGLKEPELNDIKTIQLLPQKKITLAMLTMNAGDSASFIFHGVDLAGIFLDSIHENSFYQLDLKLDQITDSKKYLERYRKLEKWLHQPDPSEKKQIIDFIQKQNKKPDNFEGDIYFYHLNKGAGKEISQNSIVTVKYTGYLLDGTMVDQEELPLTFDLSSEGQLITGLEIAIKKMKKGGKAKLIIPSHLAFGEQGSSNGLIPPKAPVIYELELIRVN